MKRLSAIVAVLFQGFMYFCLATVLALSVGTAMLYSKGAFHDERLLNMWSALHGIAPPQAAEAKPEADEESVEHPAYEEVLQKRMLASLDLDLRENTLEKSLDRLRTLEGEVRTERNRFTAMVTSFEEKISELQNNAVNQAVQETQQTLESLPPKQAKQLLLKLLEEEPSPGLESPKDAVVSLVKAMPIERRRRILAEFKSEVEEDKLAEILKDFLRGAPDVPLLRQARDDLQQMTTERP